jgi:methionyl-tRNA formyltransferase
MRVVIVGQQWLGVEVLKLCLRRGDEVVKVFAPAVEGEEYDRLYAAAQQNNIPVEISSRRIEARHIPHDVDVIICAHAHAFVSAGAREAAKHGALGYHPSLLPRHRGRDAVKWTIHMRDAIAGGTAYWMNDGADTGNIAAQDWCHVLPTDDARTLWRRDLAPMGVRLIGEVLSDLDGGVVLSVPQLDSVATYEPPFTKSKLSQA